MTRSFIFDSINQQRRGLLISYYNILNGTGMFFGALVGGLIIKQPLVFGFTSFSIIFIASGFLRLIIYIVLLPIVKEVRPSIIAAKKNPLNYLKYIVPLNGSYLLNTWPLKKYKNINIKKIFNKNKNED